MQLVCFGGLGGSTSKLGCFGGIADFAGESGKLAMKGD